MIMNKPTVSAFPALVRFLLGWLVIASGTSHAQTAWIASERAGNEARFLNGSQVLRYDLTTKSWLTPFALPQSGATAMAFDAQGAVVAYGSAIRRYSDTFTGESSLASVSSSVLSLFLDGDLVIAIHSQGLYGRVSVLSRTTGAILSSVETYVDSMFGTSHAPGSNRLYGRTQGISPSDIVTAGYTDAGVAGNSADSPYHGAYPGATQTWVFPGEGRVVDSSGTVYTAPGLNYFGSLAGTVTDIAFNGDVPVVLRGGELIAFTPTLLESGRGAVGVTTGVKLYVTSSEAFVFSPAAGNPTVNVVSLATIAAPAPGTPINPNGLAYTVDDAFADKDGNLLLFSKGQMSLFRWSPATRQYTGSFPLLGVPKYAAYSKENHSAYFAYDTQVVRKLDLAAVPPTETAVVNLPAAPNGLATAGAFVFASDTSGAWGTHYLYAAAGTLTDSKDWNYYSRVWEWDPVKNRMYFFRDDTSPNDLHFETIDAAGKITGKGETPYHGDFTVTPPIRVSPDGSRVVIGSGVVFETAGLTKTANLTNGFTDAVWQDGNLVTLRLINGVSQLQTWEGTQLLPGAVVRQFSGTPVRLLKTSAGLLVLTSVEGTPRFTLLDAVFETIFISPTKPLPPANLAITTRGTTSVSLHWDDASDNEDGFRIEYRPLAGDWSTGTSVAANSTAGTVGGLAPGTGYEFRVIASLGDLSSAPSATVSGLTLTSPNQPVGEPYNLRITRVFNTSITLEWQDNAANETGFRILRSTTATGATTTVVAAANANSFTATGLLAGTSYFFRVQAINGAVAGDLLAQVSATTLSGNAAPAAPSLLAVAAKTAASVTLTWNDNSTNEDSFVIERSTSPAVTWAQVGSVPFNSVTFTDASVLPNTAYSYRVKSTNSAGATSSSSVTVTTPKLGGDFASMGMRSGDIYYFVFSNPNRIERYDLPSQAWLAPVSLQATATAFWADESGLFVAEDRAVARLSLDGGSRTSIGNAETTVKGLFTVGNVLLFRTASTYTSLDKQSGNFLTTFSYGYGGSGTSVSETTRKAFMRSTGISPSDIYAMEIGSDGKLIKGAESPYHGTYPSATRTFVFPNGARVADDSGTVYTTDSLTYNNSLGGSFTDLSFLGADVPILLRSNKLLAYTNALLEAGSFTLDAAGLRVAVAGTNAVVFFEDGTNPHGLRIQTVPLSQIAAPQPGAPIDPRGLAYTPDDVFTDKDGNLLLFCKSQLSLFRWSPAEFKYLSTLPLLGAPGFAGYSAADHRAYFAYDSQVVRMMDLAAANPQEVPLFNLPAVPAGFTLAGEFPYVATNAGLMTFSPGGDNITSGGFTYYYGKLNTWDPVTRRVYHFRDGTSPNDLHYDTISATGQITGKGETPYHGDFTVTPPIRVSPDGTKVVIGSGVVFNASGLTKAASLANTFTDATWLGGTLVTARLIGGVTQLQTWIEPQFVAGALARQVSGTPVRLLALDASRLLLITLIDGVPRFTILNESLEPTYISPTKPLPPANLTVTTRGTTSVSLHWDDASDNEDGFRIEYRPLAGDWSAGTSVAANSTAGTVGGLAPGTGYEFRVIASLGDLSSAPSATVSGLTLTSPNQPVGEPYNLRITRVFNTSITLEWQDNAANETGFRILRSTTATGATTVIVAAANANSFTATGLLAGTGYFFRVQAINGAVAGDLLAQVSATTLSGNAAPAAPSLLAVAAKTAASVTLTWNDNSTNEDSFVIERSTSPAVTWAQVGSVPFNSVTFTDASVLPNTAYSYRVKSTNSAGATSSSTVTVTTPKLGGDFAGLSMRVGDVYHFVFSGPNRIERYDLAARNWLATIPLQAAATAFWADESAIFVAEDRAVVRFDLNGGARTPMGNAQATVKTLFTVNEVLVFGPGGGDLTTMNKRSGLFLSTISYSYSGGGYSAAPALNRAFFRSTSVSPSDIHYLQIGADGKLLKGTDSPYHGAYPSATRTFVFPNGARVADDSGTVYSTDSLSYTNSLAGAFTDLSFHGADIPIVLRTNKLVSYTNTLLEQGSFTLSADGLRVAVAGSDAVVFIADGTDSHGLRLQVVPLSALAAPVPGLPIDPRGLVFTPDDVFTDKDGNLLLFCKSQLSLFRWSPQLRQYLPTLPLIGVPDHAAYSKQTHRAYFAYASQLVREDGPDGRRPGGTTAVCPARHAAGPCHGR